MSCAHVGGTMSLNLSTLGTGHGELHWILGSVRTGQRQEVGLGEVGYV